MHSKFFSDASHGGKDKALKKAIKYRNDLEKELGKPRTDRIVVVSNARNSTGVIGVQRTTKVTRGKEGESVSGSVYEVTWSPEPNVLRKTSFSIEKYGEEEAFRKACQLRQQMEKKVYGRVIQVNIPTLEEVKARQEKMRAEQAKAKKAKR
jgi:hypothetical protein